MSQTQLFEGTAEEIAAQLRDSNLAGPLKAIVTQDEHYTRNGRTPNLGDTLADFLAEVDQIEFTSGKPHTDPHEQKISRLIAEKFARQGHTK